MSALSTSILELPTELKLQVCAYLQAREIVQLRPLCRAFRDFVDTNAKHITDHIRNRELVRLRKLVKYYVTYEGDVSFLEAFTRWIELRGWAYSTPYDANHVFVNLDSIQAFSKHWATLKNYPDLSKQTHAKVNSVAKALFQAHGGSRGDFMRAPLVNESLDRILLSISKLSDIASVTEEECISMRQELRFKPGGRLSGPRRRICRLPGGGITVFKDPVYAPNMEPFHLVRVLHPISYERWVEPKLAIETFGVPGLPWTKEFTYCCESDWAPLDH